MQRSILSTFRSALPTAMAMILACVFVGNTNKHLFVNAQLLIACSNQVSDSGLAYELCVHNKPSPYTSVLSNGSSVSFGTASFVATYCAIGLPLSVDSCVCTAIVNPSDPLTATDFCNNCTVASISNTTFQPYFDCSNRLVGDCVGLDVDGMCIDNSGDVVPAPVQAPTVTPVQAPTLTPVQAPTLTPVQAPTSTESETNQTLNYRATYRAEFLHLHDFSCTTDAPVLQVSCFGTEMKILNKSDASILCAPLDESLVANGTTYQCTNTCTSCTGVYERLGNIADGPFASVEFMCEGDNVQQVNAQYFYLSGGEGSCVAATTTTSTRNYHVGRLGVLCSTGSTSSRQYKYDDTYSECRFGRSTSFGYAFDVEVENEAEDLYTCIAGNDCEGQSCQFSFPEMRVYATLSNLVNSCIESTVGIPIAPETPQNSLPPSMYTVQFEASWAQLFESDASQSSSCSSVNPSVLITCGAGSSITFANATDSSMLCNNLSSGELLCSGSPSAIRNNFTSVNYTCTGSNLPVSQVTYPQSNASCTTNTEDVTVLHAVTLGVLCESSTTSDQFLYYSDTVLECSEAHHNFDYDAKKYGFEYRRTVCSELATIAVGSTTAQSLRNVAITTDGGWLSDPTQCYNLQPAAPTSSTVPITNPPTSSPTTVVSVHPSTSPSSNTLTKSPATKMIVTTPAPISISGAPFVSRVSNTDASEESIVGVAIGAAVGGVAIAAMIVFFALFYKRRQAAVSGTGNKSKPLNTESNTDYDFASSRSPTSPSGQMGGSVTASLVQSSPSTHPPLMHPVAEESSANDREVYVPDVNIPMRNSISAQSASSSSQRSQYPANYVVDVKDQCRSVAVVRTSTPTFISQADSNVPYAVALGVSTANASLPSVSSSTSTKREPSGIFMTDV